MMSYVTVCLIDGWRGEEEAAMRNLRWKVQKKHSSLTSGWLNFWGTALLEALFQIMYKSKFLAIHEIMVISSLTITMRISLRYFPPNPLTKGSEEAGHKPKLIFLVYCLTLWSPPVACVNMSLNLDKEIQSAHVAHELEKRSTNFIRYGFAVCELPFHEICNSNVSRIECSALGCCFHKETCYKKAVPQYMKAFVALIWLLFGIFILFMLQSCIGRKKMSAVKEKKKKEEESASSETGGSSTESEEDEY
ncbi:hypothetical protein JRQ81_019296 [Phrynocephalus forsythii]|uniref:Testis-expressed protein 29 n=1 Tax=Phrynocephalus forsythii TaxID=171643 RepID=A0A9Q0XP17_9SAUR|nr:hypothetical protein JRQ81_019296 [Phrynocephalus forsythii]